MKKIRYLIEAAVLWLFFKLFRALGPDTASNLGGFIGRTIGPRLASSRKARANLSKAFPEKTDQQCHDIIKDMWDNLGRVMAEYPHLKTIISSRVTFCGEENLEKIGKDGRCIMIGAHLSNWELSSFYFNHHLKWPMVGIYREPNNPYTARLLNECRMIAAEDLHYIPKSSQGARDMMRVLKDGGKLGILIDQKYNQGLAIPFFGHPAMTSPAFAQLAQKFDCPIVPMLTERLQGCRFRITIGAPLEQSNNDIEKTMMNAHALLEGWIRKNPGQWLWLHRRWDSKALQSSAH